MPLYIVDVGTVAAKPVEVFRAIATIANHCSNLNFAITSFGLSGGKVQLNISRVLTPEELEHFGLV